MSKGQQVTLDTSRSCSTTATLPLHMGMSCMDCHANGHTNAATHTVGDIRPDDMRHRIDMPSLRG